MFHTGIDCAACHPCHQLPFTFSRQNPILPVKPLISRSKYSTVHVYTLNMRVYSKYTQYTTYFLIFKRNKHICCILLHDSTFPKNMLQSLNFSQTNLFKNRTQLNNKQDWTYSNLIGWQGPIGMQSILLTDVCGYKNPNWSKAWRIGKEFSWPLPFHLI